MMKWWSLFLQIKTDVGRIADALEAIALEMKSDKRSVQFHVSPPTNEES
jgi:hypothetical protein